MAKISKQKDGQPPSAVSPKPSILFRVFHRRSQSRVSTESPGDIKGHFGLNLLYAPTDTFAEIIFVHGLGGGSRKTWSKGPDPESFWPKEWLSKDPEFEKVRIHSFGYNSSWSDSTERVLDIEDFARAFLAALQSSSLVRRSSNLPIVLVAHSMGGLVIKKAYLLAQQDPKYKELGKRFQAMFFLATPHHGAGSAKMLSLILRISLSGTHPFVVDLHQKSQAIQSINDEFEPLALNIRLYSFFETRKTSLGGLRKTMIVKKKSAVMGYANERSTHLNANHRDVCKFDSPNDPNFVTVSGALVENLDMIKQSLITSNRDQLKRQRQQLRTFFGTLHRVEDSHAGVDGLRAEGSCKWLSRRRNFQKWRDSRFSSVYWLYGNPATGKTFLADYVVEYLASTIGCCSSYFFRRGEKSRSSLSECLLVLAHQMAKSDAVIRDAFLQMHDEDIHIDKSSYQSIWRKLFTQGIFSLKPSERHFWVLDAIDDCQNALDILPLIANINPSFPLQIFITSRPNLEFQSQLHSLRCLSDAQELSLSSTLGDIKHYIDSHTDFPSMQGPKTREQLMHTVLTRSEGCFLWVVLVIKDLRRVNSEVAARQILDTVPTGMDHLYMKILDDMSSMPHGKILAKTILKWTICSIRPLTAAELTHALEIDINDTVPNLEKQAASLCHHLVCVDSQLHVRIIHHTARSFLLGQDLDSEFAISEKDSHFDIAMACLKCLLGDEMKAPRFQRRGLNASVPPAGRPPFLDYAAKAFSEHINRSSSQNKELLSLLYHFFSSPKGHVQSWIKYIATCGDLHHLTEAGKILKPYVKKGAQHVPNLRKEIELVQSWSTDLIRIVARFGHSLRQSPESIYQIIPPFCPRQSAIYKQYGVSGRGISVEGLSSSWDDRLARLTYRSGSPTSVACCESYLAISFSDTTIRLYNPATYEVIGEFKHEERVKLLRFNASGRLLASAGRKSVRIWDVPRKEQQWVFSSYRQPCLSLAFLPDSPSLVIAYSDNSTYLYDLKTGKCLGEDAWYMDNDSPKKIYKVPVATAFSFEHDLLAFVYRGSQIYLWNWEEGYLVRTCKKPSSNRGALPFHAASLVFNPAPGTDSLAAAYEGGTLLVFNPLEGTVKATFKADSDAQTLACSSDGRTLIGGDATGTIRIFDFETFDNGKLKLMHIIHSREGNIRGLSFYGDSVKFVDMRAQHANIWEPEVLVRQAISETTSEAASIEIQDKPPPTFEEIDAITEMSVEAWSGYVFYGTENGSVAVADAKTGKRTRDLYKHASNQPIIKIAFDDKEVIASADLSCTVFVYRISLTKSTWKIESLLLKEIMDDPVRSIVFHPESSIVLITTMTEAALYKLGESEKITSLKWDYDPRDARVWVTHPKHTSQLLQISKNQIRIYDWDGLKELTTGSGISLNHDLSPDLQINAAFPGWSGRVLVTKYTDPYRRRPLRLDFWDTKYIDPSAEPTSRLSQHETIQPFSERLSSLIGSLGQLIGVLAKGDDLLFLDQDGWVCSISETSVEGRDALPVNYRRHFSLPNDWLGTNEKLLFAVTAAKQDILLAKDDKLVVIKRGLESVENVPFCPVEPSPTEG